MKILALDLGTKTGYAVGDPSGILAGTWTLMSPKVVTLQAKVRGDRRLDGRVPNLFDAIIKIPALDWIVFEDVLFASTTLQAHLWASLRAAVWLAAYQRNIKVECVNTSTLKKFATGHGGATKEMMAAWLVKSHPETFRFYDGAVRKVDNDLIIDDNGIDAAHLLFWARKTLKT